MNLLIMVTSSITAVAFLRGQLAYLSSRGFAVRLAATPDERLVAFAATEGVDVTPVSLRRHISLGADLVALLKLARTLRRIEPNLDIMDVGTPKAGLIGGLAAVLARVPCRVYTLHGLRLEGAMGLRRILLYVTEWIACRAAHVIVCVGPSLEKRVHALHLAPQNKTIVLADGTCNGVDTKYFSPPEARQSHEAREDYGIPHDAVVVGFLGRLGRSKGVADLFEAIKLLSVRHSNVRLLLVGGLDEVEPLPEHLMGDLRADPHVIFHGWTEKTVTAYHCMDVFVLPSYREGFPYAPMEAAATALPTVVTRVTGSVDAVDDGVTGITVPARDPQALAQAIECLIRDLALRQRYGAAGRERVIQRFGSERIWSARTAFYANLATRGCSTASQNAKS